MAIAPSLLTLGVNASPFMTHLRVSWIERAWMRHLARRGLSRRRIARGFGRNVSTVIIHCDGIERRVKRHKEPLYRRRYAKARRDALAAQGLCLNGASHGPATHGVLCAACREVHRRSQ